MATGTTVYAGLAAAISGTWSNLANAQGSTTGTYATWASTTRSASATVELSTFGAQSSGPGSQDTINSVTVTVRHLESNTTVINSVTAQLYSGATAIGAAQTLTRATAVREDTFTISGVTYAQLADLRVRVTSARSNSTTSATQSVDSVRLSVDYTAYVPPPPGTTLLAGDTTLSGKAEAAAGTPYKFGNIYTAIASGIPTRLSYYGSSGATAPVVVPIIYSVSGGNPANLIGYGNPVTVPANSPEGWYDLPFDVLAPNIASGTQYLVGFFVISGDWNNLTNQTSGTVTTYYCFDGSGNVPGATWGANGTPGTNAPEQHTVALYMDASSAPFIGWGVPA